MISIVSSSGTLVNKAHTSKDTRMSFGLSATLNECHPAIQFTMEIAENNKLPFLGMMIEKSGCYLTTSVYCKPTDTGLLLHYQSHVDQRYKRSLLNTMLNRAYRLSSTKESFTKECQHLKRMFTKLKYPVKLINSAIAGYTSFTIQSRHEIPTETDAATPNNFAI